MNKLALKIVGIGATLLAGVSAIASSIVSKKQMEDTVNEAVDKKLKEMFPEDEEEGIVAYENDEE